MTLSLAALLLVQAATPAAQAAEILAGYAAKMICSTVFVSHRDPAAALLQDLARSAAAAYRVDSATRSVVASLGATARRAVFRDGLGCTLRPDTSSGPIAAWKSRPWPPRATGLWPAGERVDAVHLPAGVNRALLRRALDSAFAEPGPTGPRRTRAVVVAWNGRIVAERYAEGFDAAMPQIGWSATKSVTNAMVGILVKAGKLEVRRPVQAPEWQAT
ncbi:MAG: serine hydrolase, partial [Gemmatimonadota bacterium]